MASEQLAIPGSEQFERKEWNTGQLLSVALQNNAAIDVIERLAALREKELARQAEVEFVEALNRVQSKIKRIAPDLENPETHSRYATYAAIDRVIRPIYSDEGFSMSFSDADCPKPDHIRILCYLSRGGHTRTYMKDMPVVTTGPKGKEFMTLTHATAGADSYAKRYLVKDIWNIAIGEDDADGNTAADIGRIISAILECDSLESLEEKFKAEYKAANGSPKLQKVIVDAKDKRKRELFAQSKAQGVPLEWGKK